MDDHLEPRDTALLGLLIARLRAADTDRERWPDQATFIEGEASGLRTAIAAMTGTHDIPVRMDKGIWAILPSLEAIVQAHGDFSVINPAHRQHRPAPDERAMRCTVCDDAIRGDGSPVLPYIHAVVR